MKAAVLVEKLAAKRYRASTSQPQKDAAETKQLNGCVRWRARGWPPANGNRCLYRARRRPIPGSLTPAPVDPARPANSREPRPWEAKNLEKRSGSHIAGRQELPASLLSAAPKVDARGQGQVAGAQAVGLLGGQGERDHNLLAAGSGDE